MTARTRMRRLGAQAGTLAALAALVLVTAFGASAWPRGAQELLTAALRSQAAGAAAAVRDLSASFSPELYGGSAATAKDWAAMPRVTAAVRRGLPAGLSPIAGPGRFWGQARPIPMNGAVGHPVGDLAVSLEADPRLAADTVLVRGALPSGGQVGGVLPVAIPAAAAAAFRWHLGQVVSGGFVGSPFRLRLVGFVRPRVPGDDYFSLEPDRVRPTLREDDSGYFHWSTVAYLDATQWPAVSQRLRQAATWLLVPLAGSSVTVQGLTATALPAVRRALATALSGLVTSVPGIAPFPLTSQFGEVLDDYAAAAAPVAAISAVVATGPLATLVVLVGVALTAVAARRARSDRLTVERGGDGIQVRGAAALDVAMAGVPAALAGGLLGVLATPGGLASPLLPVLAAAVLPPLAAAVVVAPLAGRPHRRARVVTECLVVALAAFGIVVLLQRGVDGPAPDPIVVGTPLAVAVAVCVPVLRVLPFALRAAGRLGARRAGIAGLLGSRLVAAGGGGAGLVAVVSAVAIAAASVCLLGTVRTGTVDAAVHEVGADLIVADVDGIPASTASRLQALGATTAQFDLIGGSVETSRVAGVVDQVVFAADPAATARVQRDLPARDRTFADFVPGTGLTVGTGLRGRASFEVGGPAAIREVTARLIPVPAPAAITQQGVVQQAYWCVVDRALVPAALLRGATPAAVLAALPPGADPARIAGLMRRLAPHATVLTVAGRTAAVAHAPLVGGLEAVVGAAALLAAVGAALTLALSLIAASRARTRLAATLRALGLSGRQSAALVVWDAIPAAVTGVVVGLAAGVGVAALLLVPVNVAPIVGSSVRPPLVVDPALLGAVAGVTLAAAVLGTAAAVVVARRADVATVLRFTESGR